MINKVKLLPDAPGCYLMKDQNNVIIYVGKAKNLKKRVTSYFIGSHNSKTELLVSEIVDFSYIVTKTELEAFILELNLIKEHDPKYNIRLTDDKTYPYIVITKEIHPRLLVVRDTKLKGNYFGPYPDVKSARETVKLLHTLYPLRKCYKIPKVECLYYHMHQCLAPCINEIKISEYEEIINEIKRFLNGDVSKAVFALNQKMDEHSQKMQYELANECYLMIKSIEKTIEKQKIIIQDQTDRDIIAYYNDEKDISIYHLFMRQGKIITTDNQIFSFYKEDLFDDYLALYYKNNIVPKEILLQEGLDMEMLSTLLNTKCIIPVKGPKKALVEMAYENAKQALINQNEILRSKDENIKIGLNELSQIIKKYPKRIEAFDNSNTYGKMAISAMVSYLDGKPSKKDYRKFHIQNENGFDDYQAMEEVIYRRYYRVLYENLDKPDLIIIDGGIGQLKACQKVLAELHLPLTAIALKKDHKHKTDKMLFEDQEILLDRHQKLYLFLSSIQEEVHRFAITFHKTIRGKSIFNSVLVGIKGLGNQKIAKMWKTFQTVENIINASVIDMKKIRISEEMFMEIKQRLGDKNDSNKKNL